MGIELGVRPAPELQLRAFDTMAVLPQVEARRGERPNERAGLASWVTYFDSNYGKEGLSFDWYNLRTKGPQIGFSIRGQMKDFTNPKSEDQVATLKQRTKQDLLGFKLEYLSDHLVYPRMYHRGQEDPTRLEDPLYGKLPGRENTYPDIEEIVSADERGGSVKRNVREMKKFLLAEDTPDGSMVVMTSPKGPTGLKTDNGKDITYPDSYFFIMQKTGDTVMNYTLKTDFTLEESREAVFRLTGKRLAPDATLVDFVNSVAMIKHGERPEITDATAVVRVLESVRPTHAHKETGWADVYKDIQTGERLYDFDRKTHKIIEDFEKFCVPGHDTTITYQKAIAATLLRMSDVYFNEEDPRRGPVTLTRDVPRRVGSQASFGDMLTEVAKKPGCAGGGGTTAVKGIGGERSGSTEWFSCPKCQFHADGPIGNQCPGCGITKDDFAQTGGVVC